MCEKQIIVTGEWYVVEWATKLNGSVPGKEFYENLSEQEKARVLALFSRLAEHRQIRNREQFKKVEGYELFEFKKFQTRFLGDFRPGRRFVVATGLNKKSNKLKRTEIEKAINVLGEHDERNEKS